ncbi:Adenylate cyclase [Halomonadaceae bacterium LMG 33818]|uniref:CYTH domain-containing protein n=1 Tax=Cernens ardua TaxID=3402176 RepID=UPI003EDC94A9
MTSPHTNATNEEIELKLALGEDAAEQLAHSSLLASATLKRMTLGNRYFDTPDSALRNHKLALRLRKGEYDSFTQTLKSAGRSTGGLSQRGEWQWATTKDVLNLDVLKALAESEGNEQPALQILSDSTVLEQLEPVFITDFKRLAYTLEWKGALVELAIDQGTISVGDTHRAINEVELELKKGEPDILWSLAEEITHQVAARPANASKASRAAALMKPLPLPESLPTDVNALFAAAIAGLDTAQDSAQPEPALAFAKAAFEALGKNKHYAEAEWLASQLAVTDWQLKQPFGEKMMSLARRLAS